MNTKQSNMIQSKHLLFVTIFVKLNSLLVWMCLLHKEIIFIPAGGLLFSHGDFLHVHMYILSRLNWFYYASFAVNIFMNKLQLTK